MRFAILADAIRCGKSENFITFCVADREKGRLKDIGKQTLKLHILIDV